MTMESTLVSTDGGDWYPQSCRFLKPKYRIHSPLEKSLIERSLQHIKDRTDALTIIFHAGKESIN